MLAAIDSGPVRSLKSAFNYLAAQKDYVWLGKDPNVRRRSYGWYDLQQAAYRGETGRAKILLGAGANPNIVTDRKHASDSPLNLATRSGPLELMELLLKRPDIDLAVTVSETGYTLFYDAVNSGNPAKVKLLLDDGRVDPNKGPLHAQPLWNAVMARQPDMLRALLADPRIDIAKAYEKISLTLLKTAKYNTQDPSFFGRSFGATPPTREEKNIPKKSYAYSNPMNAY